MIIDTTKLETYTSSELIDVMDDVGIELAYRHAVDQEEFEKAYPFEDEGAYAEDEGRGV
jgi:hypothetical protein